MHHKRHAVLALVLALLLLGSIYGCQTPTPEPTPTFTPKPTLTPIPEPTPTPTKDELDTIRDICADRTDAGIAELEDDLDFKGLVFVDRQIIVTGPPSRIDPITRAVPMKQIGGFDLSEQKAIRLYEIGPTQVQQTVCVINTLGLPDGVTAEPNYHLSPAQWIGGGSPWTQNGEWAHNGGGQGSASAGDFLHQWAFFGTQGMHLFRDDGTHWNKEKELGKGTRIAIFDTSPFEEDLKNERCDNCPIKELMGIEGKSEFDTIPMTLTVWHQIDLRDASTCPGYDRSIGPNRSLEDQDISNHGLFVAGLAHAVAPESDIYLIRVLEDDGCGTLLHIIEGIHMFMDEMIELALKENPENRQPLRGTVINLSFGMHKVPGRFATDLPYGDNEVTIDTLRDLLKTAVDIGAVVVAAAGNDSYEGDQPRAMELPAGYDFVIGVAASSETRERGCFSNAGNAAAPGGDGVYQDKNEPCVVPDCTDDDSRCLISLVRKPNPDFAYWVGTSFATPLVSGQAALALQNTPPDAIFEQVAEVDICSSPDSTLQRRIISRSAAAGDGCPN